VVEPALFHIQQDEGQGQVRWTIEPDGGESLS